VIEAACYRVFVRAKGGARCAAFAAALATAAACGSDFSATVAFDGAPPDAAHRGDSGPFGGPVFDADVVCPSIGLLFDHFDDIDEARWTVFRDPEASTCTVEAVDGALSLTSPDGTVECGIASAACYDMTDRALMIDAALPGDDGLPSPFLRVALAGGGSLDVRVVEGPSLELVRDAEVVASVAFDGEQHRLWRVMHTAVAGRIDFQAAPIDTTDWTTLASTDVQPEEVKQVKVLVGAAAVAAPGDAVGFDELVGIDF
jgi:hypothetical protein